MSNCMNSRFLKPFIWIGKKVRDIYCGIYCVFINNNNATNINQKPKLIKTLPLKLYINLKIYCVFVKILFIFLI